MNLVDVDLAIECDGWPDEAALEALANAAFGAAMDVLELEDHFNVSLLFTDDKAMQTLNLKWRGFDKPTNVLSFPAGENVIDNMMESQAEFLGDIALALETVRQEAVVENKIFDHHLTHLLVHGFLHLCGYDHETGQADTEEMETLERAILARLAISDPYAIEDSQSD